MAARHSASLRGSLASISSYSPTCTKRVDDLHDECGSESDSDNDAAHARRKVGQVGLGTEERLQREMVKLDCRLEKLQDNDHGWQPRRVVVTAHEILFFKPGSQTIIDVVPLNAITRAYIGNARDYRHRQILQQRTAVLLTVNDSCVASSETVGATDTRAKQGVFKKRGQVNAAFKSRFFVLDRLSFRARYYESEDAFAANEAPNGTFSCVGLSVTKDAGETTNGFHSILHICQPQSKHVGGSADVVTKDMAMKTMECAFHTDGERTEWIEAFESVAAAGEEMRTRAHTFTGLNLPNRLQEVKRTASMLTGKAEGPSAHFLSKGSTPVHTAQISGFQSIVDPYRASSNPSEPKRSAEVITAETASAPRSRIDSNMSFNSIRRLESDESCKLDDNFSINPERTRSQEDHDDPREFVLETDDSSKSKGKVYFLRADTPVESNLFIETTHIHKQESAQYFRRLQRGRRLRKNLSRLQTNSVFQALMASMIVANFIVSMVELEIHPVGSVARIFTNLDIVFTIIFLLELLLNMAANWFWPFWRSSFNVFDFCIVAVTTISLVPSIDMKIISTLRLLRAFRVVRLFGRLGSARTIIVALSSAMIPVCNVLVVVVGIMCVFAMFGATAYAGSHRFETFSVALFSMFQVLCLDGWGIIMRDVNEEVTAPPFPTQIFFIVYIFCVVWVLMPVFIAAILDGYRAASFQLQANQQRKSCKQSDQGGESLNMAIDPILHSLCLCSTTAQLRRRLDVLFEVMDVDESGQVSFEEMVTGLGKMDLLSTKLTMDEYECITRGGKFLSDSGEFTKEGFQEAMLEQWKGYIQRKIAQYILLVKNEDPSQEIVFFALKLLVSDLASIGGKGPQNKYSSEGSGSQERRVESPDDIRTRLQTLEDKIEKMCEHQTMQLDYLVKELICRDKGLPVVREQARASRDKLNGLAHSPPKEIPSDFAEEFMSKVYGHVSPKILIQGASAPVEHTS